MRAALLCAALALGGCADVQQFAQNKLHFPPPKSQAITQPAPVNTDPLHEDADHKLAAYKYADAEAAYKAVLAMSPNDNAARLGLAESELGMHEFDAAYNDFTLLATVQGFEARSAQGIGLVEMRRGNIGAATGALTSAVGRDASLWRAWNALGQGDDLSKDWQGAAGAYAQALAYAPPADAPLIHNNMGVSLMAQAHYDDALKEFDGVLKSDPNLATARTNRQIVLALLQRYPDALAEVPPEDKARGLNNIGYVAMLKGDYGNAEKFFTQAMQESPGNKAAQENLEFLKKLQSAKTSEPDAKLPPKKP